jgi:hypothetical protein
MVIDLDEIFAGYSEPLRLAERKLLAAVREGESAVPQSDQGPAPAPGSAFGWRGRAIRASVIATALTDERVAGHFRGLRLSAALIDGTLDLSWADLRGPLVLERCRVVERILMSDAKAKEVVFTGCHLVGGMEARRLQTGGSLDLSGSSLLCDLQICDARIGGDLILTGATVQPGDGDAVDAAGIHVAAGVQMDDEFVANGPVSLPEARVARSVSFDGAKIDTTSMRPCLSLVGARIDGDLTCQRARLESDRGTGLHGVGLKVAGRIDCSGGRFVGGAWAITFDNAEVGASMTLSVVRDEDGALVRFEAEGSVRISEAKVGKQLNCRGGLFHGNGKPAFNADSAEIEGSAFLDRAADGLIPLMDAQGEPVRFEAYGPVILQRAKLLTSLSCSGGRFINPDGIALDLYGATIDGDAFFEAPLDYRMRLIEGVDGDPIRFEALGTVRLHGAHVGGQLSFRGALVAAEVTAVDGRMLEVGRNALFDPQRNNAGTVLDSKARSARFEVGAYVGVNASPVGFAKRGLVQLIGANITGDLDFLGARLTAIGNDLALEAQGLDVERSFVWRDVECKGRVKLRNSTVGVLKDELSCWATGAQASEQTLDIDHFTYQSLARETGWKDRSKWLQRQRTYSPHPYSVLAESYRRVGDDDSARKISMERVNEQVRRRGYKRYDPRFLSRWLLRYTIGHGYEPWRALWWALGLWALAWVTIALALSDHAIVATRASANTQTPSPTSCERPDYPCLTPPLLAADFLVPVVTLGQRDYWRVNGALGYRLAIGILIVAGWLLTTMVVAGFTGIVRRE